MLVCWSNLVLILKQCLTFECLLKWSWKQPCLVILWHHQNHVFIHSQSPPFLWRQSLSSEFFSTSSKPALFTSIPPYGLPPNYTPPNVAHAPDENVDNFAPIPIETQHPQSGHAQVPQPMGETHEVPRDHTLADFVPHLGYATEGQAFGSIPLPNTLGSLSIAHNHNPYILRWKDCLLPWCKGNNLII